MPYALLSVYDKSGLNDLAHGLIEAGYRLMASGSTAQHLAKHNLAVLDVATYTKSPELFDGRIKTLHPAIYAGILARRTEQDFIELQKNSWDYIDIVVVNLYPFYGAIEQIDIGGQALMRAAAKNYPHVLLASHPNEYADILSEVREKKLTLLNKQQLAARAFFKASKYDADIASYFDPSKPCLASFHKKQSLRYGENPHQSAELYSFEPDLPLGGTLIQGKALSYNNLLDLDAGLRAVSRFDKASIAVIKHLSPCGLASADRLDQAVIKALACDPLSAFGSVIAANREVDDQSVLSFGDLFIEAILAPSFSSAALKLLARRTQCRLLALSNFKAEGKEWRSIHQGFLCQDYDSQNSPESWQIVSQQQPNPQLKDWLMFAWSSCQQVRSNAIVLVKDMATVGIGTGQPNRLDALELALKKAGLRAYGSVLASDGFLPFADVVELAVKHGIMAIIQPGGSIRDHETLAAANRAQLVMIHTGVRHFRH